MGELCQIENNEHIYLITLQNPAQYFTLYVFVLVCITPERLFDPVLKTHEAHIATIRRYKHQSGLCIYYNPPPRAESPHSSHS